MSGEALDDEEAKIDPRCDADVLAALGEGERTHELGAAMDEVVAKYVPDRKVYNVKDAAGTDVTLTPSAARCASSGVPSCARR